MDVKEEMKGKKIKEDVRGIIESSKRRHEKRREEKRDEEMEKKSEGRERC